MNLYIKNLKDYFETYPKDGDDFQCVLDVLYYYYTQEHSVENGTIRAGFRDVGTIVNKLNFDDNNALFSAVVSLCEEHSKQGFLEDIRVGAELAVTLQIQSVQKSE